MVRPIETQQLTFSYGKHRGVVDLTLSVEEGEIFGFLGPNGAGKTTTIRMLMGLIRPDAGWARIFGRDAWSQSTETKRLIGFLPGDIRLYEQMTGRAFLAFFAGFRAGENRGLRDALVERMDLDLSRQIKHLSKGNRQKLAVVQAFMHDAPLLILDEPSSGLDPLMQAELIDLIRDEQARGKTIFLSSHVLPEVERIAHRVAIIREGRLVAVEEVARLRAMRQRQMDIVLGQPLEGEPFAALDGVRVLSLNPDRTRLSLAVRGDLSPLLRTLGALPVEDLVFGPPDLESVFLHYYSGEEQVAEPQEAVR